MNECKPLVAGVEQHSIHIKPAYVTTSWSVYAGFLEVTLPVGSTKIGPPDCPPDCPQV